MNNKLPDLNSLHFLKSITTNPRRSKAFNWLMKHYELLDNHRNYWKIIKEEFDALGFRNKFNQPYSTKLIGKIWRSVKKAKKIENALNTAKTVNQTQLLNPFPPSFISNECKEEIEITKGEEWAAKQKAKILQQLEERKKRI